MASAEGSVQHLNYVSTFPLLLNISSQPTYFMALKDSAGLVKMFAMVNVEQYQIVATGQSVEECYESYKLLIARSGLVGYTAVETSEVSGVIDDIRTAVIEGNTHYYIKLRNIDCFYRISAADVETVVILGIGDRVIILTSETEGMVRSAVEISLG
jgi:hypothetical protein